MNRDYTYVSMFPSADSEAYFGQSFKKAALNGHIFLIQADELYDALKQASDHEFELCEQYNELAGWLQFNYKNYPANKVKRGEVTLIRINRVLYHVKGIEVEWLNDQWGKFDSKKTFKFTLEDVSEPEHDSAFESLAYKRYIKSLPTFVYEQRSFK